MKNMTKKPAFSLMEVMVILLIMAVTLAATAPMISKKMSRNVGTAEEPWKFSGSNQSISFNGNGRDNSTVFIGTDRVGNVLNGLVTQTNNLQIPLYIRAIGKQTAEFEWIRSNGSWRQENNPANNQAITFSFSEIDPLTNLPVVRRRDYSVVENLAGDFDYTVNHNGLRINDNRLQAHLGMAEISGSGFPFFSGGIPRTRRVMFGNRLSYTHMSARGNNNNDITTIARDVGTEDIEEKVILGYDCNFSEHRSADHQGKTTNTAVQNKNLTVLGSNISASGLQNSIQIGVSINSGWSFPNHWNRCVVINTAGPRDFRSVWEPQHIDDEGNVVPGAFVVGNQTDDIMYNMLWMHEEFNGRNTNGNVNLDNDNNGDMNNTVVNGVTVVGGRNSSAGRRNTMLGYGLHCGRSVYAVGTNNGITTGDFADTPVSNSVAIGNFADANGNNSVAVGSNVIAGIQQLTNINLANGLNFNMAQDSANNAIAIGAQAQAISANSIAIGRNVSANAGVSNIAIGDRTQTSVRAIAIGNGNTSAQALASDSIAIGTNTRALGNNSVAIGNDAVAQNNNEIVLGNARHTVEIPGTLSANNIVLSRTAEDQIKSSNFYNDLMNYHRSDIRLKNVGEKFTSGLEDIKKLNFFNYTYKNDKEKNPHVGVMAQDLQKVFPISVSEGSDGYLRIRLDEMFYAALNAIKELDQKIIALAGEVKEFFSRVDKLELRVAQHQTSLEDLKAESADIEARLSRLEK